MDEFADTCTPDDRQRWERLGRVVDAALAEEEHANRFAILIALGFSPRVDPDEGDEDREVVEALLKRRYLYAGALVWESIRIGLSGVHPRDEISEDVLIEGGRLFLEILQISDPVDRLQSLISLVVAYADTGAAVDQSISHGELDRGDVIPDELMDLMSLPHDHQIRSERAAEAALEAYYAPLLADDGPSGRNDVDA